MLFKYRFINEFTSMPILEMNIERFKLIASNDTHTAIFLNRAGTRKYIRELNQNLDSKAANIKEIYS